VVVATATLRLRSVHASMCQDAPAGCHTGPHLVAPPSGQPSAGLLQKRRATPMTTDERRMLELLAVSEEGRTDALLFAHGLALEIIFNVVKAGLAIAQAERLHAASPPVEIVRITGRGRWALAEMGQCLPTPSGIRIK
jgi:hypothetical protein